MTIYTAPWVVPITSPTVADGAVVAADGRIVDTGPRVTMLDSWKEAEHVELRGVLMPALVNCHAHLELSWLGTIQRPGPEDSMTDWIEAQLQKRQHEPPVELVATAIQRELEHQHRAGVVLVVDIDNRSGRQGANLGILTEVVSIHEVMAPTAARTAEVLRGMEQYPQDRHFTAHAPYSTTPQLIKATKKRCRDNGQLFSIHTAESKDEIDFIRQKTGPFRTLLNNRQAWDGSLAARGNFQGSVAYLSELGVLDERTLCVHCVHVSSEEIEDIAAAGSHVCLCPGSNEYLRVGRAPLEKLLSAGLLPAIGTDSITSNESLDMWRELGMLRKNHPTVKASTLLAMATLGGARASGYDGDYGSLEKGKKAVFLQAVYSGKSDVAEDVEERLVTGIQPESINWITG